MKRQMVSEWFRKFHRVSMVLILVAMLCLASTQSASAAAPSKGGSGGNWQLVDYHQNSCFSPRVTTSYYGIWIRGTWTRPINVGITNLPSGGTYSTSYAPIPPGSSDGVYSLAYVAVTLPSNTAVGVYTASLWASDGGSRQTVPVTLDVRSRCGY